MDISFIKLDFPHRIAAFAIEGEKVALLSHSQSVYFGGWSGFTIYSPENVDLVSICISAGAVYGISATGCVVLCRGNAPTTP
jgi:hypothetical protein